MGVEKYPHLFQPLQIRGTVFRNRIFSSPQGFYNVTPTGYPNADLVAYFEAKARGGMAAVCLGDCIVDSQTVSKNSVLTRMDDPGSKPGLATLAGAISRHGAIASVELQHQGMYANAQSDKPLYGPSNMKAGTFGVSVDVIEMTDEMIEHVIASFGKAAAFAKRVGFGMITIHAGHGWLLNQFMSSHLNHRKDKWGGSVENRIRITLNSLEAIRRAIGPNMPIEIRMSGAEWPGSAECYDIDEGVRFAKMIDGYADIIHVTAGTHEVREAVTISHPSMFLEDGVNSKYAAEIKKHVKCYVGTVGSFSNPGHMEETLASGVADIIHIARQSLADPNLPIKARTGREDEITECIRCMQCYRTGTGIGSHFCSVNPITTREREVLMAPPPRVKKTVLVAGGGIAGMQAAITAAERGHNVILCEKGPRLGGILLCEEKVPFKKHLAGYIAHQALMISRARIDVRLNTEVTPGYVKTLKPDVVIAALGARPVKPQIPGIDGANVMGAEDAYINADKIGKKAVIIGGGLVGLELAVYLSMLGREVTVIEIENKFTTEEVLHTVALMIELDKYKVDKRLSLKVTKITDKGVFATGADGDVEFAADTVIYSTGQAPLLDEAFALHACADEFHHIGDCVAPKTIMNATHKAFVAAYDIGAV